MNSNYVPKPWLDPDRLTSILGAIGVVCTVLNTNNIYPKTTGLIAGLTGALFAYYTNKRIEKKP